MPLPGACSRSPSFNCSYSSDGSGAIRGYHGQSTLQRRPDNVIGVLTVLFSYACGCMPLVCAFTAQQHKVHLPAVLPHALLVCSSDALTGGAALPRCPRNRMSPSPPHDPSLCLRLSCVTLPSQHRVPLSVQSLGLACSTAERVSRHPQQRALRARPAPSAAPHTRVRLSPLCRPSARALAEGGRRRGPWRVGPGALYPSPPCPRPLRAAPSRTPDARSKPHRSAESVRPEQGRGDGQGGGRQRRVRTRRWPWCPRTVPDTTVLNAGDRRVRNRRGQQSTEAICRIGEQVVRHIRLRMCSLFHQSHRSAARQPRNTDQRLPLRYSCQSTHFVSFQRCFGAVLTHAAVRKRRGFKYRVGDTALSQSSELKFVRHLLQTREVIRSCAHFP
jgi:hypothetical protein